MKLEPNTSNPNQLSRRSFGGVAAASALFALANGATAHAENASPSQYRTGNGEWTYDVVPQWGKLPQGKQFGGTHGAISSDKAGNIYVSTQSETGILVYERLEYRQEALREVSALAEIVAASNTAALSFHDEEAAREILAALHGEHAEMLDAFVARDAERLLAVSAAHHRHLEESIAALPRDSSVLAWSGPPDAEPPDLGSRDQD